MLYEFYYNDQTVAYVFSIIMDGYPVDFWLIKDVDITKAVTSTKF